MKVPFKIVLSLFLYGPLLAALQCENTLPDGTLCREEDYLMVADPKSCWKYYECDTGCVTHQTCPDDNKFDPEYAWCTYPQDVDCGDRPCDDDVHCHCYNTLPGNTVCGEEDYLMVADPKSCWKYYECDTGCVTHQTCPDDNKFDPEYAWCTYPEDVDCGDRPCDDDVHCHCYNTLPGNTVCGEEDYLIVADPKSCWKYYECDNGCVTHQTCPDDNKFDPEYSWCTYPQDVDCGDRPCDDDVHCHCYNTLPGNTVCGEEDYLMVADPKSCWKYYECDTGCVTHQTCPDDNKFDPEYAWCTYPQDVDCGGRPCDDNVHCPASYTMTSKKPTCDNTFPDETPCGEDN